MKNEKEGLRELDSMEVRCSFSLLTIVTTWIATWGVECCILHSVKTFPNPFI